MVVIRPVGPEAAAVVADVVRQAFADRPVLDPPTDALAETEESVAALLASGGGLLAEVDGRPVATVVLDRDGEAVWLRRFGVVTDIRGAGVARDLARAALAAAGEMDGVRRVAVLAREELPATVRFWCRQGFAPVGTTSPYVELARAVPLTVDAPDADAMQDLARRLAPHLGAGDVLVLSGELGAGKTTFTQGLGDGLGVRGGVTSPTFVIARVHPSLSDGPSLVHVDAYRLGDGAELDDLDLDASLDESVTVVEWGAGLAEALSDSPLEIRIARATGAESAAPDGDDPRRVEVDPHGARWLDADLAGILRS